MSAKRAVLMEKRANQLPDPLQHVVVGVGLSKPVSDNTTKNHGARAVCDSVIHCIQFRRYTPHLCQRHYQCAARCNRSFDPRDDTSVPKTLQLFFRSYTLSTYLSNLRRIPYSLTVFFNRLIGSTFACEIVSIAFRSSR